MADRVRKFEFDPYSAFCAKYFPFEGEFPASRLGELQADMINTVVEHTDPVPGSSPEVRAEAVRLMEEFIAQLDPGQNVNRDMLMEVGGLPKDNKSDGLFTTRWAKENAALEWNPARTSHFVRRIANGHDA